MQSRRPKLVWVFPRILLVTFILTAFSFAVSLLLGIFGIVIGARLRGGVVDMRFAYRHVAAPVAAVVGIIVLVSATVMEMRHYRQSRTLAEIEKASVRG
jgi:uncharacterized membrane protein